MMHTERFYDRFCIQILSEFEKWWYMRVGNGLRASEKDLGRQVGIKHSNIKVSVITMGYSDKVI
jgi:hypothetical protein